MFVPSSSTGSAPARAACHRSPVKSPNVDKARAAAASRFHAEIHEAAEANGAAGIRRRTDRPSPGLARDRQRNALAAHLVAKVGGDADVEVPGSA